MKPTTFILSSITLPLLVHLLACSSSSNLDGRYSVTTNQRDTVEEKYLLFTDSIFKAGYTHFTENNYQLALLGFNDLITADTELSQYEGYAFAADCYNKLGQREKGSALYDSLIDRFATKLRNHPDDYDLLLSWRESKYMKSLYPVLPFFLLKENGFVPYDSLPRPLETRTPLYPEAARKRNIEGIVWVKLRLSGTGKIEKATIVKSPDIFLSEEVAKIIYDWTFSPYRRKGRLSEIEVSIPFRFILFHQ